MTPHVIATSLAMEGQERQSYGMARRAISVVAGARNHLQANMSPHGGWEPYQVG